MEELKEGIAIVGIACRFPGAKNKEEFWSNLLQEKESIKVFSDDELKNIEFDWDSLKDNPAFVKARGVLDDVDKWDANFFNVMPKDAEVMDPQQRIWLENTWHAFEDAGYNPFEYKGSIGVYAGSFLNTYLLNNVIRNPKQYELYLRGRTPELFQAYLNSDPMFLATRTAFFYNLKGPAINVQTACSTSLVAISQACNSLLGYETDMCIAGGVTVVVPQETGYLYQEGAIGSPDGHCKPFSKDSKGTVFGNGVGTVVLKRVEDAIKDNDRIYAVIQGWATNNDGSQKAGFTAPSVEGQYKVIRMAQSFANINADEIAYIEAHGTATPLGDPIEVSALSKAFGETTDKKQFCGIGSVKSNIGHLDAAAGVAGLIKVALAAHNKTIPATLHFDAPNPRINFNDSPFYVLNKQLQWDKSRPLTLGVSSFGVGGTNAHIILSSIPEQKRSNEVARPLLHLLSAQSKKSLNQMQSDFLGYLHLNPDVDINDVAYTQQLRRKYMSHRSFIVNESGKKLDSESFVRRKHKSSKQLKTVFLFPGQGAQYALMGKELYEKEPVFRDKIDTCFELYTKITGESIKDLIFLADSDKELSQTKYTQPALFIIEYALASLYAHFDIRPDICLGHSIGEYAAACIAGVFDLKSALSIVIKRGELMQKMPEGEMMAVFANAEDLESSAGNNFELAAVNSQTACTISLEKEQISKVKKSLEENNVDFVELNTSHAFHSKAFDPILNEFKSYVQSFELKKPNIPFISCLSGDLVTNDQAISGEYWAQQLRGTVMFSRGVESIVKDDDAVFLEVGPNTHLSNLVIQNESLQDKSLVVSSIGKLSDENEQVKFVKSLGNLWLRGIDLDFLKLYNNNLPKVVNLPPYPFDRKRYWIDFTLEGGVKFEMETPTTNGQEVDKVIDDVNSKEVKEQVKVLLAKLSGYDAEDLVENESFLEIGFDSMFLAQFAMKLSDKYKLKIEFRQLVVDFPNILSLSEHIKTHSQLYTHYVEEKVIGFEQRKKYQLNNLAFIQPNGSQEPLIFVHGDNANRFLPAYLGNNQPYYGFLHLGADGEKNPFTDAKIMAKAYLDQLTKKKPNGPYYLGGFSFGGILAYEMAIMLQKMGHKVPKLVLFDCPLPGLKEPFKFIGLGKTCRKYIVSPIYQWFIKFYREAKCRYYFVQKKPLPVEIRNDYIVRKYYRLMTKYKHEPEKFDGEMLLFKVESNHSVHKYLGWDQVCSKVEMAVVKGDHENFLSIDETTEVIKEKVKKFISN